MKLVFIVSLLVNVGMWFERYVIIVTSLHRDYLPSSWQMYYPTLTEWGIMIGVFGIFFTLFLLFTRLLPVIAIAEVKSIMKVTSDEAKEKAKQAHHTSGELNVNVAHSPDNQNF